MGYLIVNIIAEEIFLEENEKKYKNDLDQKLTEGKDPLLVRLALILRDKGLKMNSAFNIFDKDKEDQISLDNFRSIALFTLKFEQKDLDKLIEIIFGNKVVLDRQDFYQIFNNLLVFEDENDFINKKKVLGEHTQASFNIIDKPNNKNLNTTGALNQFDPNASNSGMIIENSLNDKNNLKSQNITKMNNINNNIRRKSKSMNEIMLEVDKFMVYIGKRSASDLFKIFDQDTNLKVGMKELANGFGKMGIKLNPEELDMLWKSIVGKSDKDNFGVEEFITFYEKHKIFKRSN